METSRAMKKWKFWQRSYSPLCKKILHLLENSDGWYADDLGRNGRVFVSLPEEGLKIILSTICAGWVLVDVRLMGPVNYDNPMDTEYESVLSELSKQEQRKICRGAMKVVDVVQDRMNRCARAIERPRVKKAIDTFLDR